MIVTCRQCADDFDTTFGVCPACGHAHVEPHGHPAGPSCGTCGTPRFALNGEPLALGDPCESCGSMSVRVPRRDGEVVGKTIEGSRAA